MTVTAATLPNRDRRIILSVAAALALVVMLGAMASPVLVIGTLLGGIAALVVLRWPHWALAALLFVEPFHNLFFHVTTQRGHLSIGPLSLWKDLLLFALVARGLGARLLREGIRLPDSGIERLVLTYVLFLGLLATVSPNLHAAGYGLAATGEGPLLFLTLMALKPPRRMLWVMLGAIICAGTVMATAALIEQGPHEAFQTWFGAPRPASDSAFYTGPDFTGYRSGSFFGSPLILAFYLAANAPLALGVGLSARMRWLRLPTVAAAALCAAALYFTQTRSGYLGAMAGVLVALVLAVSHRKVRTATVGLIAVLITSFVLGNLTGYTGVLQRSDDRRHGDLVARDLDRISQHPLGFGLGTVDAVGQRFHITEAGGASESTWLAKALEGGVFEMVLYMVVVFSLAMSLRAAWRRARDGLDQPLAGLLAGALGALVAVAVAGIFLGQQEVPIDFVWWGAAGTALAMSRVTEAEAAAA